MRDASTAIQNKEFHPFCAFIGPPESWYGWARKTPKCNEMCQIHLAQAVNHSCSSGAGNDTRTSETITALMSDWLSDAFSESSLPSLMKAAASCQNVWTQKFHWLVWTKCKNEWPTYHSRLFRTIIFVRGASCLERMCTSTFSYALNKALTIIDSFGKLTLSDVRMNDLLTYLKRQVQLLVDPTHHGHLQSAINVSRCCSRCTQETRTGLRGFPQPCASTCGNAVAL